MSFALAAVKKIFSVGKKIIGGVKKAFGNKWFRTAFITGLTLFTAGLGGGGFASFRAAMAGSGSTTTVGSFFSAVGSTIASGFSNITTSVGSLLTPTTATGGTGGIATPGTSGTISGGGPGIGPPAPAAGAAKPGLLNRLFGSIFSSSPTGTFMRSAIVGGISFWAKQKEADKERKRRDQATVFGGPAFGGSATLPDNFIRKPVPLAQQQGTPAEQESLTGRADPRSFANLPSSTLQSPLLGRATQINTLRPRGPRQQQPLLGAV